MHYLFCSWATDSKQASVAEAVARHAAMSMSPLERGLQSMLATKSTSATWPSIAGDVAVEVALDGFFAGRQSG